MTEKKEFRTVIGKTSKELEIRKSIFISHMKACKTEQEALDFIEEIKKEHRTATHNCYAYAIGARRMTLRYSDDGEPQGTAGIPMLEVLNKEALTNVCLVVTRYFGGIKLGTSGLIRAYSKAASQCIEEALTVYMKNYLRISLEIDYTLLGKVENYIQNKGFHLLDTDYTDKVKMHLYIPRDKYLDFENEIIEMTNATGRLEVDEELLLAEKNGKIIGG